MAGDGFSLSNGSFPMICSLSLLSSFLHITQLYLIVLTIFNSLTIQNLVRILLAVERTPRCPLLWICSLYRRENRVIIRKKHEFIFVVTHLNPPFSPSSNHVYPICILSGAQTFVSTFLNVFIHAFYASIIQNFSAFVTSLGVSDCPACLKDDFGFLWYIAKILAVTLIRLSKSEYLSMLILDANVSLSSLLKCVVIVYAILINPGSCTFVSALCLIGHSDSGNSRNLGPFCQMLSKFISLGFLPRVNQSAISY